jgi:hypothetical protein
MLSFSEFVRLQNQETHTRIAKPASLRVSILPLEYRQKRLTKKINLHHHASEELNIFIKNNTLKLEGGLKTQMQYEYIVKQKSSEWVGMCCAPEAHH